MCYRMEQIIERYQKMTGTCIPDHDSREQLYGELAMLRKDSRRLHSNMRRYTGEDMSSIPFEELDAVEQELERAVNKVRHRKNELLHQQLENLRRKVNLLINISDSGASCRAGISTGGDRSKAGGASASLGSIPILWRTQ
ncbi:hypothetical protein D5086_010347 [Populus alba]|uniref:Uncharacterized protein n=1 Tax=Populus alba TaxID=43335 RepID=A0ACC4C951_POPAL